MSLQKRNRCHETVKQDLAVSFTLIMLNTWVVVDTTP